MDETFDSYRFISGITRRMLRTWVCLDDKLNANSERSADYNQRLSRRLAQTNR